MKTVKIIGSFRGPLVKLRKFNVPKILAKPVKAVLEFCGYYVI